MESKLQELTQKIYHEGIDKAKSEAAAIITDARKQAEQIVEAAKKEADSITSGAKKDADQLSARIKSELKMASEQAVSTLKQNITDLLSKNSFAKSIADVSKTKEFIVSVVKEIASKWDPSGKSADLTVILPEKMKSELENYFKAEAKEILSKGLTLKFDGRMTGGFKVTPKDSSFVLSFTDDDLNQFFQSFLKTKTKEILYPGV